MKRHQAEKKPFWQNGFILNVAILYDLCIDSAYAGKSTCTTTFAERSFTKEVLNLLLLCMLTEYVQTSIF